MDAQRKVRDHKSEVEGVQARGSAGASMAVWGKTLGGPRSLLGEPASHFAEPEESVSGQWLRGAEGATARKQKLYTRHRHLASRSKPVCGGEGLNILSTNNS